MAAARMRAAAGAVPVSQASDHTDPGLRVLYPPRERRRKTDQAKQWLGIVALVGSIATAGGAIYKIVAWPWLTRDEANRAHESLAADIRKVSEEHRAGDRAVIEALEKLGEKIDQQQTATRRRRP